MTESRKRFDLDEENILGPQKKNKFQSLILADSYTIHPVLSKHFGYCLSKAAARLRLKIHDAIASQNLLIPQAGILSILESSGPLPQHKLGDGLDIDPASMVKLIDCLEKNKLVKRSVDQNDRRAKKVEITPKGIEAISEFKKIAKKVEDEFFSPLNAEEKTQIRSIIPKLLISD